MGKYRKMSYASEAGLEAMESQYDIYLQGMSREQNMCF